MSADKQLIVRIIEFGSGDYIEALRLRYEVLRQPLGLQFTKDELAQDGDDLHLAVFQINRLVGCLTLMKITNDTVRFRQVAVAPDRQGHGVGRLMNSFAEAEARRRGFLSVTLTARETAIPFYEKLGYVIDGELHIERTIPHVKMRKNI